MGIDVRNITKTFGAFTALRDVTLSVATGELVALLGPSGSGKTTLLRIIAGLEEPDAGSGAILFHEEDVARRNVGKRQVGFVFQHYALFRHMNVFENVAFGLRVRPRETPAGTKPDQVQGDAAAEAGAVGEHGPSLSAPALRRPAAARGAGPGAGDRAEGAVVGRAVRGARRDACGKNCGSGSAGCTTRFT